MARKLLAGLVALLIGCAYTAKFEKADPDYCNSLVDCIKKGPPEEKKQESDYEIFLKTYPPIEITKGSKTIRYIENMYGPGYCLAVADGTDENMYCSLNSNNNLDAYSWSYIEGNQKRSMTVLRSQTPMGVNGKDWPDLELEFREAQFIFGNLIKNDLDSFKNPYLMEALRRIRGF